MISVYSLTNVNLENTAITSIIKHSSGVAFMHFRQFVPITSWKTQPFCEESHRSAARRADATSTCHACRRVTDTRLRDPLLVPRSFASVSPPCEIEANARSAQAGTSASSGRPAPSGRAAHKREKQETAAAKFTFQASVGKDSPRLINPSSFFRARGSTANKQKQRGGRAVKAEPIPAGWAAGRIAIAARPGLQNYFWPLLQM